MPRAENIAQPRALPGIGLRAHSRDDPATTESNMPIIGLLHLLVAIAFIIHAHKTGRPHYWMMILLFLPLVGSIAYVLIELLPEAANSRRARKVAGDLHTIVDPHRELRRLTARAGETDTVEAKCRLAEEFERKGMWDEAIGLYRQAAQGIYAEDGDVVRGLARALLGSGDAPAALETLDRLKAAQPDYQNQDAHMTYARALEATDRLRDAEAEYAALSAYFVGLEARTRHGLILQRLGEPAQARRRFEEVVKASQGRGIVLTPEDREWARVAGRNLG